MSQHRSDKNFCLIEVPQTGGASFLRNSPRFLERGSSLSGNDEKSISNTPGKREDMIVFLRNPDDHVLSQFMTCKFSKWGKGVVSKTFPKGEDSNNIYSGFRKWLNHFAEQDISNGGIGGTDAFNCYNPWNMQSRYMATAGDHTLQSEDDRFPSIFLSERNLLSIYFVGIFEFMDTSICLLMYKNFGYIHDICKCENRETMARENNQGKSHNVIPMYNFNDLSGEDRDIVRNLVTVDHQLYNYFLETFWFEVKRVRVLTNNDLSCGFLEALERKHAADDKVKKANEDAEDIVKKANEDAKDIVKKANETAEDIMKKANEKKIVKEKLKENAVQTNKAANIATKIVYQNDVEGLPLMRREFKMERMATETNL
eukprot:g3150.t1